MQVIKVGLLKKLIEKYPDDMLVYLTADEEWNEVRPSYGIQTIDMTDETQVPDTIYNKPEKHENQTILVLW